MQVALALQIQKLALGIRGQQKDLYNNLKQFDNMGGNEAKQIENNFIAQGYIRDGESEGSAMMDAVIDIAQDRQH